MDTRNEAPRARHMSIAFIVLVVALTLVQLVGSRYYSTHFTPGTRVNGQDVSGLTQAELERDVRDDAASWSDHVTGQGIDLTVRAKDISLDVKPKDYARKAMAKVDGSTWLLDLVVHRRIAVTEAVDYDAQALQALVSSAVDAYNAGATAPTNATAAYDGEKGAFAVTKASVGTQVDAAAAAKHIARDVVTLRTSTSLGDSVLAQPAVTSDNKDLLAAVEKANGMIKNAPALTKDGKTIATPDAKTVAGWLSVGDDLKVAVNQDAIASWASDSLAKEVAGADEVHDYALDAASLAASVSSSLESGSKDPLEVPLTVTATRPEESEGHESRGRHLDVNLSTQYARLYDTDGTVLWRSYFVSGNTATGHATPTGTYAIEAKRTDQTLVGADKDGDGEPDYRSKVKYWMPFLNNDYGLHDASWRGSFGGSIYTYNGSHGCVNLPTDAAAQLYSLIRVGDKVYVHK